MAPPDPAEPEKVDARTVQRSFEPRYSTSAFNALLGGELLAFAVLNREEQPTELE